MFEDVIKAISQMEKMDLQSERDKMNERLKVGVIQDVPPPSGRRKMPSKRSEFPCSFHQFPASR